MENDSELELKKLIFKIFEFLFINYNDSDEDESENSDSDDNISNIDEIIKDSDINDYSIDNYKKTK